jgi:hypothetical protein
VQEQLVPENRPAKFPSGAGPDETNEVFEDHSWAAAAAVAMGILGLFVLQLVLGPATIVASALAWHRGEGDPWARKLARIGYGLGVLDGLVWLIAESVFHVRLVPF